MREARSEEDWGKGAAAVSGKPGCRTAVGAVTSKEWRQRIIKLGLRRIRFHDLRHTHRSHMLASNVHPKNASA
jgi:integrase